jgi:uncharacterized protein YndB with AHSA1/START domain
MPTPSAIHSTFVIERSYPATPERVFAAFADPNQKRRWFVESPASDLLHYEMDFRAGGRELSRAHFKPGTPIQGLTLTNDTIYQNIVPNRRIVTASTMTLEQNCFSASQVTLEFLPTENGTDLICTHQGAFFEGADGPEMREAGWRKLLDSLATELAG